MRTPARMVGFYEKCKKCTASEKAVMITAFLNEYGEHATWEEWCSFLQEHHAKGFEWTRSVD